MAGVSAVSLLTLAALSRFLAPSLSYQVQDRVAEAFSGRGDRPFRIALGVTTGSYYRMGVVLNRHLKATAGYELELIATGGVPENVGALLDLARAIDLAFVESSSDEAASAHGLCGLAAVGPQYFFVIVPNESPVQEIRDLAGAVNPGVRTAGQAPTLGEKVLEYYGLLGPPEMLTPARQPVSIVRPLRGIVEDFDAKHMQAATRTQSLRSDLVENVLRTGKYRLLPIPDHEALARSLPGTEAGFIPAGAYGPERRIPPAPVPTLTVATLLIARRDLPGRVARDLLETIYDPRVARDLQQPVTEQAGRQVGSIPLHPAADIFYRRHDLVTSDRLGRISFVASGVAALAAALQFGVRFLRNDRRRARRRRVASDLERLRGIRQRIEGGSNEAEARASIAEADALLDRAERDAAAGHLDADGIRALRSAHEMCGRALPPAIPGAASGRPPDASDERVDVPAPDTPA